MKDDETIDAIRVYLNEQNSDYAVMLNGQWGCGKTFFVKNKLINRVQTECQKNCIYISLFGVSSIEDLENSISLHILNIFANKKVQTKAKIFNNNINTSEPNKISFFSKVISRGLNFIPHGKDVNILINDINREIIKYDDYFFIFDDFERSNIDILALLGFLDGLSDQNMLKAMIVLNEDKLDEKQSGKYNEFKEKIIGLNIDYDAKFEDKFNSILDLYFQDEDCGKTAFLNNKNEITRYFSVVGSSNFRTLIFAIKRYKEISSRLDALKILNNKLNVREKLFNDILLAVCGSSLLIKEKHHKHVYKNNMVSSWWDLKEGEEGQFDFTRTYEGFYCVDKYIENYNFDEEEFTRLIDTYIEKDKYDFYEIIDRTSKIFRKENDIEAISEYDEIINKLKSKKYNINVYPGILENLFLAAKTLFNREKVDELKNFVIDDCKDRKDTFNVAHWNISKLGFDDEAVQILRDLGSSLTEENTKTMGEILNEFLNGEDFATDIFTWASNEENPIGNETGFFANMDLSLLKRKLEMAKSKEISTFKGALRYLYRHQSIDFKTKYKVDKCAIEEVITIVKDIEKQEKEKIRKFYYRDLLLVLETIYEKL